MQFSHGSENGWMFCWPKVCGQGVTRGQGHGVVVVVSGGHWVVVVVVVVSGQGQGVVGVHGHGVVWGQAHRPDIGLWHI